MPLQENPPSSALSNSFYDYVDPTNDYVFKKIFGQNEKLFISFVNSIFQDKNEQTVKSVTFINSDITKDIINGKQGRLDVKATLDDGSIINIEVQVDNEPHYIKRTLFYWSSLYRDQLKEGEPYYLLNRCVYQCP